MRMSDAIQHHNLKSKKLTKRFRGGMVGVCMEEQPSTDIVIKVHYYGRYIRKHSISHSGIEM